MPNSVKQGKEEIKKFIQEQGDIKTILDIGCGEGTYPKLLGKDYVYLGVEIYEPYVKMFDLTKYYKSITIADVSEVEEFPEADCVIFGDVLEHLEKDKAFKVINNAIKHFKHIIVSIPKCFMW